MRSLIASIEAEYRRNKRTGEGVLDQLDAAQLKVQPSAESNSLASIVWHIAGNLESRFTDFLTTDGEKPWRERDDEFAVRDAEPEAVREKWERGWMTLFDTLSHLNDADLGATVMIRGEELSAAQALFRSLAHTSSHVGQMTYVGKMLVGPEWQYLSIPPGGTAAYNRQLTLEKGPGGTV